MMQADVDVDDLAKTLSKHISEHFLLGSDETLDQDRDVLADGLIDSMGVMELVSYIEDQFEVAVPDEDIVADNFRSVRAMTRFVAGKLGVEIADPFIEGVQQMVLEATPPDAVVLLLTSGDDALVQIEERTVWHFPCDEGGQFVSGRPQDGAEAIAQVSKLQARGATHIAFPEPELWWLDHYSGLAAFLESSGELISRSEPGVVYSLG